jgi:bacterioferritin-associated ferredoxin
MYVCLCSDKTENEILVLLDQGIDDITTIVEMTEVGSGCGTCILWVEKLIAERNEQLTS